MENIEIKSEDVVVETDLKSKVEAVLFITSRAMQPAEIAQILSMNEPEIDDEDGYIIQVRAEHMDIVEKLCPVELTPAVLKTLTVIALKEPIRQTMLKELRPSAYEHITELLQAGLISRTKDPKNGRSFNIRTTKKFKEYFKLKGDIKALVKRLDATQDLKDL